MTLRERVANVWTGAVLGAQLDFPLSRFRAPVGGGHAQQASNGRMLATSQSRTVIRDTRPASSAAPSIPLPAALRAAQEGATDADTP